MASSGDDWTPTVDVRALRGMELDVARIVAETEASVEVYAATLAVIGTALEWPLGAIWELDALAGTLRCGATWTAEGGTHDWVTLSQSLVLRPGQGLPGRVLATGSPDQLGEAADEFDRARTCAARSRGLRATVAFPLRSASDVVGVLEFVSRSVPVLAPDVLAAMRTIGGQLGQRLGRRRAEAVLSNRESRLRAMLEAALDAVVTIDAEGRVLGWNHAAEAIFGYAASVAVGRELAELIVPPALREDHRRGLRRYLETERPVMLDRRVELTAMRRDGTEFPVELAITRIGIAGPPTFTGYLRDITDRVKAERELQASRRRLVEVADRERRAIQHALRDGAQQRLTSVLLSLGRLRAASTEHSPLLTAATDELGTALREIRELASGLHPTVLAERGLAAAIQALALRAPAPLELEALPGRRLPEPVEAAAYHVAAEALLNVMTHAQAQRVVVRVVDGDRDLVVEIVDDGVGGADPEGAGLRGLADRVQALDGRLTIETARGRGTRVSAVIPHRS